MPGAKKYRIGIVWFRQDLRLGDNPALSAACAECEHVVTVFIHDPSGQTVSQLGQASNVWLHHALCELDQALREKGNALILAQGKSLDCLDQFIDVLQADALYWNRCYDPVSRKRDEHIKTETGRRIKVQSFNGMLLREPWELSKPDGTPYRVFTPFWKKLVTHLPGPAPLPKPKRIPPPASVNVSSQVASVVALNLLPDPRWDLGMMQFWQVGSKHAQTRLNRYVKATINDYSELRNRPGSDGTSRLSPHLHFGEISARQVIHKVYAACPDATHADSSAEKFAREIGWREFAYHLLFHFPTTVTQPMDKRFDNFQWATATTRYRRAWERGMTGVPIVDAGMRQLWQTGWMHNRVRMIVGSYLVKNLLVRWQHGEKWFRETLVDADLASNVMGWQWVAGSGADAAPFFRVFNPVLQGEKFDPDGVYVRTWIPELATTPSSHIHKPWELPKAERPAEYPPPLVDLKESRMRALMAFDQIKSVPRS